MHKAPQPIPFEQSVAPYRRELHLHCYRMLGSLHEADDMVQETLVRAWRGFDGFDARGSLRAWLYRIATNTCLSFLARHPRRILPEDSGSPSSGFPDDEPPPVTETAWIEPYPDRLLETAADPAPGPAARYESREATEIAFIAAVQYLPPRQRAALLLCDVLGWSASETAALLDGSAASVNSALQRGRATLKKRWATTGRSRHQNAPSDRERQVVSRYMRAWERADLDELAALLREDALLSMPPLPQWYRGRSAIRDFFSTAWALPRYGAFHLIPLYANKQPGCAVYSRAPNEKNVTAHSLHVFTLRAAELSALTLFLGPSYFVPFALPLEFSAGQT